MEIEGDPRILGVLLDVMLGYSDLPRGYAAQLLASPRIPDDLLDAIAIGTAFAPVPEDFDDATQTKHWEQILVYQKGLLPALPAVIDLGAHENLRCDLIRDSETLEAILHRAVTVQRDGWKLLDGMGVFASPAGPEMWGQMEDVWWHTQDAGMRSALLGWMSAGDSGPTESAAVLRLYAMETDPAWRAKIAPLVIDKSGNNFLTTFRTSWTHEADPQVQLALVNALVEMGGHDALPELARMAATATGPVRGILRKGVERYQERLPSDQGARLLEDLAQ